MFCKQCLAYTVYIDGSVFSCYPKNNHVSLNIIISVLTTCTFMFRQACTIEPSFFKMTSGMHLRLFKGQHLVFYPFYVLERLSTLYLILFVQCCKILLGCLYTSIVSSISGVAISLALLSVLATGL